MPIITAIITEDAKRYWPRLLGGFLTPAPATNTAMAEWDMRMKFFKVGEGGWINPGTGEVPRDLDPSLRRETAPLIQDLDAVVDATRSVANQRYPSDSRATYSKALMAGDFSFESPNTLRISCFLDFAEFNDDGFGNNPRIWEIGIYADHPVVPVAYPQGLLVAYGTFPLEIKTAAAQLENIVRITAG